MMSFLKRRVKIPTKRNPDATWSLMSLITAGVLLLVIVSCTCCFAQAFVTTTLREIGVLPTETPSPTHTATPSSTPLPTATSTVKPSPLPTDTSTPRPSPTSTRTPEPVPTATLLPPTATQPPPTQAPPTETPQPTAPPAPTGPIISIVSVNKRAEYVDIRNDGDQPQDLAGWVLLSEKGNQICGLGGMLNPGEALRIWAMAEDSSQGGYNCGFGSNIWNNSEPDAAILYDSGGQLIDRYP